MALFSSFGEVNSTSYNIELVEDTDIFFVYDTTKDSDGGAWRKRTQHTSWYNEALNTSTRGSRREFPAVALIAVSSTTVTIYDADVPEIPMWMVFQRGVDSAYTNWWDGNNANTPVAIHALNGIMVLATSAAGYFGADFVGDRSSSFYTGGAGYRANGQILRRNGGTIARFIYEYFSTGGGIGQYARDIHMRVLPNAPIDPATGLERPTYLFVNSTTNLGGVVLKDDGTRVVTESLSSYGGFIDKKYRAHVYAHNNGQWRISEYPYTSNYYGAYNAVYTSGEIVETDYGFATTGSHYYSNSTQFARLNLIYGDNKVLNECAAAYITTSYNTGWMHGDIKVATLIDSSDANVTGSELVTNGTFNSDVSGWTTNTSTLTWNPSGYADVARNNGSAGGGIYQTISGLIVGEQYVVSGKVISLSHTFSIYISNTEIRTNTTGTFQGIFIATSTSTTLAFNATSLSTATATIDNISVKLSEKNRAPSGYWNNADDPGNAFAVVGTINKDPVSTGSDLVAYSNFSTSNYIVQQYNPDLDFGFNPYTISFWIKSSSVATEQYIFNRRLYTDPSNRIEVRLLAGGTIRIYTSNPVNFVDTDFAIDTNKWYFITIIGNYSAAIPHKIYVNGFDRSTIQLNANSISDATIPEAVSQIGLRIDTGSIPGTNISLALFKISSGAIPEEMIPKIYEDEKSLFSTNSKCLLTNGYNTINALAFDEDNKLLHAGTSAGRFTFSGLTRVSSSLISVGSTLSVSNGLIAER